MVFSKLCRTLLGMLVVIVSSANHSAGQTEMGPRPIARGTASVDGKVNEWKDGDLLFSDPANDSDGHDLRRIHGRNKGSLLFLRIDLEQPVDSKKDFLFGIVLFDEDAKEINRCLFDCTRKRIFIHGDRNSEAIPIRNVKATIAVCERKKGIEMGVDLIELVNPFLAEGRILKSVAFFIYDEKIEASDSLVSYRCILSGK